MQSGGVLAVMVERITSIANVGFCDGAVSNRDFVPAGDAALLPHIRDVFVGSAAAVMQLMVIITIAKTLKNKETTIIVCIYIL